MIGKNRNERECRGLKGGTVFDDMPETLERMEKEKALEILTMEAGMKYVDASMYCLANGIHDRGRFFEEHKRWLNWEQLEIFYDGSEGVCKYRGDPFEIARELRGQRKGKRKADGEMSGS